MKVLSFPNLIFRISRIRFFSFNFCDCKKLQNISRHATRKIDYFFLRWSYILLTFLSYLYIHVTQLQSGPSSYFKKLIVFAWTTVTFVLNEIFLKFLLFCIIYIYNVSYSIYISFNRKNFIISFSCPDQKSETFKVQETKVRTAAEIFQTRSLSVYFIVDALFSTKRGSADYS